MTCARTHVRVNDALSNDLLPLGHFLYLFSDTHVSSVWCIIDYTHTGPCIVSWFTQHIVHLLLSACVCIIVYIVLGIVQIKPDTA